MAQYDFVTIWQFEAPLENVWKEIRDIDSWPSWWYYVKSVSVIKQGDADDIGSIRKIVWTTALPYRIIFETELVATDPFRCIEGIVKGQLTGKGIWTFTKEGSLTTVRYDWSVRTTSKWMNWLAPLAKPLFIWNHNVVMNAGYHGLRKRLQSAGTS